ncbi:MAG: hypothetical protein JNN32_06885 [Flavobacteriales bacterium]|nr:hypothetical protein [Flavobacteriales bacterium]
MKSIYPTTLFHFTTKDWLYAILKDSFGVSYAKEKIESPNGTAEFGVPMVSFCDLRLTELKTFVGYKVDGSPLKYGNFGIGLTKDWANKNGLNPVWYVNRHSSVMDHMMAGVQTVSRLVDQTIHPNIDHQLRVTQNNMMNTYRYIKNYRGTLERRGQQPVADYPFADEREWRFVPSIEDRSILAFVGKRMIDTETKKKKLNASAAHIKLTFKPEDIKYLIVEHDSDIIDLVNHLNRVKSKFDRNTVRRLTSRILTADQIHDDV